MASNTRRVRGEAQKNIVRAFEGLCGRHGRWEVWADWITMSACAISTTVDKVHREEREETYKTLQKKYTDAEMQSMAEMLGMVVAALEENPDQDLLGELFMALGLGNDHAGQFFTPYNLCKAMSAMTGENIAAEVERRGWISANDPACGAGALLVAFANECKRQGVNYQTNVLFVAQDIDYTVGMMCYIQLSLLGCAGYVVIGDSLVHPATAYDQRGLIPRDEGNVWYTPMFFLDMWAWRRTWAQMEMIRITWQQAAQDAPQEPPKQTAQRPDISENEHGQLVFF